MKRLVGIRPTGKLHLGHYFSVIKPALKFGCDVLIARYHAPYDYVEGRYQPLLDELKKFIPEHQIKDQELNLLMFFQMLTLANAGELNRMTQYKSAKVKNAHLFIYPVLMACDVAGYEEVYVGEDQRQHLEFANRMLLKWGCPAVKAKIVGGRIMSLNNPSEKMSKSNPEGCLFLSDATEVIKEKIKKAITTQEGINNLKVLYKEFVGKEYNEKQNQKMKEKLAEAIIKKFK